MKTQNSGTSVQTITCSLSYIQACSIAFYDYRKNRENGTNEDIPNKKIPSDGKFILVKGEIIGGEVFGVKEDDGEYRCELCYSEGVGDKEWMNEKDRNYLARIFLVGAINDTETEDLNENKKRAEKAAKEVMHLDSKHLSEALKKFLTEEKRKELLIRFNFPKFFEAEKLNKEFIKKTEDLTLIVCGNYPPKQ